MAHWMFKLRETENMAVWMIKYYRGTEDMAFWMLKYRGRENMTVC